MPHSHSAAQAAFRTVRLADDPTPTVPSVRAEIWIYDHAQGARVPLGSGPCAPQPPNHLGPYQIVRELGRGGMGVVYQAYSPELDRMVALKLLHVGANEEDLTRLRIEARALAKAAHPNIVQIHGIFEDAGRWYLVLDLINGPSLRDRIEAGPLGSGEAARIALALASALSHIHARGILHRDVKPANVLLTSEGTPVLTDFGLARDTRRAGSGFTVTGAILGTPAYMSPEQAISNWSNVDHRTDVYSLGATLYAMLSGQAPFRGALLPVLQSVVVEEPPVPSSIAEGVDPDLEVICLKAMSKRPEDRYASASDLAASLHAYLRGKPIPVRVMVFATPSNDESCDRLWRQRPRSTTRRLRRAVLAASLGALFALGLAVPLAAVLSPTPDEAPDAEVSGEVASFGQDGEALSQQRAATRDARVTPDAGNEQTKQDGAPGPPTRKGRERQRPGGGETSLGLESASAVANELRDLDFDAGDGLALSDSVSEGSDDEAGAAFSLVSAVRLEDDGGESERSAEEPTDEEPEESASDDTGAVPTVFVEDGETSEPAESASNPVSEALLAFSSTPKSVGAYTPYAELVSATRDSKGYVATPYYNDVATQRPHVVARFGDAILVGHATRVDWIVGGGVYEEVQLQATIRGATVAAGRAFVATADAAVQGSGDVYMRGLDGRWVVTLDGAGTGAVVGTLGGDVYAVLGGAPAGPATVHRFDVASENWELVATLGDATPTVLSEFMGELWVVATPSAAGDSIHLYSGSGQRWAKAERALGSKKLKSGERVRGTASLVVRGNLFVATVKEDVGGAVLESELLVYDAGKNGEKRFKRLAKVQREELLCLAYQDHTLYAGTSQGRLLYLERKLGKKGKVAKKFGTVFQQDPSIGLNGGVSSLLPMGQGMLLVGLTGNAGTEILLRAPRPTGPN